MRENMSAIGGSAYGGKTLVVFYSRTGTTKKVGEMIAQKLNADVEEIKDTVNRSGAKGYLISGRDSLKKGLTKLEPVKYNPASYDLVIIGTPIWAWSMSAPVRTYLTEQKDNLKNNSAFFCTMGGSGNEKAFSEMENIIGRKPKSTLALKTLEVVKNNFGEKLESFIKELS